MTGVLNFVRPHKVCIEEVSVYKLLYLSNKEGV